MISITVNDSHNLMPEEKKMTPLQTPVCSDFWKMSSTWLLHLAWRADPTAVTHVIWFTAMKAGLFTWKKMKNTTS